jgi:hypothetical protein
MMLGESRNPPAKSTTLFAGQKGKINAERKDAGRGSTVASLHVKAAKIVVLRLILQIMQIVESTSYVESAG